MKTPLPNSLLHALVDESTFGIAVYNADGDCIFVNNALPQMIGATKEQVLAQNIHKIESWRKSGIYEAAVKTLESGTSSKNTNKVTTTFGKTLWLEFRFNRFENENEKLLILGLEEVSDREEANILQKKANARLETLVSTIPGITYTCANDEHWTMEFVSDQIETITGYPASDFLNNEIRSYASIVFEEDICQIQATINESLEMSRPFTIEYCIKHADGGTRWVYENGQGIKDSEGNFSHLTGVIIDITEQKVAQEMQQTSQLMLDRIMDQTPLPMHITNTDGTMVRCNQALLNLLKISEDEIVGKYNLYSDPVLKEQGLLAGVETVFVDHKPFEFYCSWSSNDFPDDDVKKATGADIEGILFPIFDATGAMINAGCIYRDVTEHRKFATEREEFINKLEAQNAELERFTYTVSHDLKSPLITVGGFVELIREKLSDEATEKVEKYFDHVLGATDKMQSLLSDLLELSRIGRIDAPFEAVDLKELAEETIKILAGQIKNTGAKIEISREIPDVFGDKVRLGEVLQNLFDNALKYSAGTHKPVIKFGSRYEHGDTVFFVSDTGIGVDPRYKKKVFELFDQLDPKIEGSGIGLALVKRIIETHKGRIWVESEGKQRGSTFCFTIPRQ